MVEEFEKIEMAKRKLKEERLEGVLSGKLPESAIIKVCVCVCVRGGHGYGIGLLLMCVCARVCAGGQ